MTERVPFLPVLIIPGFMSSRLKVVESTSKPSWVGKSLWLNLMALGFQAVHFGGAVRRGNAQDDQGLRQHDEYRNLWIKHMTLLDDMENERDGVKVRPIPGLQGVDYLTTGLLKEQLSYVFGPVVQALKQAGYEAGVNVDAAPYDWRLTPQKMQQRDGYFTNTMDQIEELYKRNNKTPVVLVCHSMGCKQGHYLLNFAKDTKGQDWIDKYIHTYIPVGGPHLGAPKSLRAMITGDKMSLDAFLSHEEALILGRSLGSGPWLCPGALPGHVPPTAYFRKEGFLEVQLTSGIKTDALFAPNGRKPKSIKITVVYEGRSVSNESVPYASSLSCGDKFVFAIQLDKIKNKRPPGMLTAMLSEPGIAAAQKETKRSCLCQFLCCLLLPIRLLLCMPCISKLLGVAILGVDKLTRAAGGASVFASTAEIPVGGEGSSTASESITASIVNVKDDAPSLFNCFKPRKSTEIKIKLKWTPWGESQHFGFDICAPSASSKSIALKSRESKNTAFETFTGSQALHAAGARNAVHLTNTAYAADVLGPRNRSSLDPPPVKNVLAIYGVNLETEVSVVYRRKKSCVVQEGRIYDVFCIDKSARLQDKFNGCVLKDGVLYETPETEQLSVESGVEVTKRCCGDGTVPYWSLNHVQSWSAECNVMVQELEKAEHREILADGRLHEALIDYITRSEEAVASSV